jgi:hypothetical protein
MAENLDAELYRQALRLVLGELEDLDAAHAVDIGYRIGELTRAFHEAAGCVAGVQAAGAGSGWMAACGTGACG